MSVERCPVCCGRGIVPQGFYLWPEGQGGTSSSTAPETCKSCSGMGYIIVPSEPINYEITNIYDGKWIAGELTNLERCIGRP